MTACCWEQHAGGFLSQAKSHTIVLDTDSKLWVMVQSFYQVPHILGSSLLNNFGTFPKHDLQYRMSTLQ